MRSGLKPGLLAVFLLAGVVAIVLAPPIWERLLWSDIESGVGPSGVVWSVEKKRFSQEYRIIGAGEVRGEVKVGDGELTLDHTDFDLRTIVGGRVMRVQLTDGVTTVGWAPL